ncbi:hydantoinase/oxoprolinase family protein [Mesorhizobium sp. 1B3]|uniref:hydantoinase/oxoprolinase family protein n=1 Tax=Mesorhizobium sp. 1B3 TaxID=3243599 RepID=UPI003D97DA1B
MEKGKNIVAGFDIGGAHLKVARAENGRVVAAATLATPLWQGLGSLVSAFNETASLHEDAHLAAFTMTGELADIFRSRQEGVAGLLVEIGRHCPSAAKLIYAGRSGFVNIEEAGRVWADVASANWHATASLVARHQGDALFVDMGSTTTDIIPIGAGTLLNEGYTDAERLLERELVYTGFTRTFLFGIATEAPVRGRLSPLMNEYFASMADVHRILGVLDESDDKHSAADGKEKTVAASTERIARMVGRDAGDLAFGEWLNIAAWFSERQLRALHDATFLVTSKLVKGAPIVGAGTGRWQVRRLADRMDRAFIDFAEVIPADDAVRAEAGAAAPAAAVALLAG